jgi:mRNA-degrading endonuclease RelE of RelBE toxin-antitoxin system
VKTVFKSSFAKDLKSIKSKPVLDAVAQGIERVEAAQSLRAIPDVKKLQAKGSYYRIKLGEHRIGSPRPRTRSHSFGA